MAYLMLVGVRKEEGECGGSTCIIKSRKDLTEMTEGGGGKRIPSRGNSQCKDSSRQRKPGKGAEK